VLLLSLSVSEFKFDGFSIDMTRSMVAMRDVSLLAYLLSTTRYSSKSLQYLPILFFHPDCGSRDFPSILSDDL